MSKACDDVLKKEEGDRTLYVGGIYRSKNRQNFSDPDYDCYQIIKRIEDDPREYLCWAVNERGRKTPFQHKSLRRLEDFGELLIASVTD